MAGSSTGTDYPTDIAVNSQGTWNTTYLYVVGSCSFTPFKAGTITLPMTGTLPASWMVKASAATGNPLWAIQVGAVGGAVGVTTDGSGSAVWVVVSTGQRMITSKYNGTNGVQLWTNSLVSTSNTYGWHIAIDPTGTFLYSGGKSMAFIYSEVHNRPPSHTDTLSSCFLLFCVPFRSIYWDHWRDWILWL